MTTQLMGSRRFSVRSAAVVLPFVAAWALGLLRELVTSSTVAVLLVLLVVAFAALGDRITGMLAALSAAAGFDMFLTEPYGSLVITDRDDIELSIALVLVGLAVTEVAQRGRRRQVEAARREAYLEGLSELLELEGRADERALTAAVTAAITRVLGVDRAEIVAGPPRPDDAVVDPRGRVLRMGHVLDVERQGLPTEGWTSIPLRRGGGNAGHVRVVAASRVVRPTREELRTAVLLASQWTSRDLLTPRPPRPPR